MECILSVLCMYMLFLEICFDICNGIKWVWSAIKRLIGIKKHDVQSQQKFNATGFARLLQVENALKNGTNFENKIVVDDVEKNIASTINKPEEEYAKKYLREHIGMKESKLL